ncbi:SAM-dependent methyltransferase [Telmatospirillum siberiense]|uniref:SAM-dependent methyltransferase n=2 Tax=Telmatospirillum siberiense TaxID=382514 RepID=A0A2N3PT73_9PROT|nr:SAM-dependent methyltransferase [Telmatospirillum siberiense]
MLRPKKRDITMPDVLSFLQAWTFDPLRVGAIAPSGEALANLITRDITPASAPVLELGPGTGVFTRALLGRGLKPEDLTLIEYGAEFAELLKTRFPTVRLLRMDAARLDRRHLGNNSTFGTVVSGLPLLSMPPKKVFAILAGAFGLMRPGSAFYQFTYGPRCPISRRILDRLGLKATCVGRAYLNIPPAAVYRIVRRKPPKFL